MRKRFAVGLKDWIIKYSDGKADPALVEQWINIPESHDLIHFYHPTALQGRGATTFFCHGNQPRIFDCEAISRTALDLGIITSLDSSLQMIGPNPDRTMSGHGALRFRPLPEPLIKHSSAPAQVVAVFHRRQDHRPQPPSGNPDGCDRPKIVRQDGLMRRVDHRFGRLHERFQRRYGEAPIAGRIDA
jgi:hypothetical protein